jgi:MoxR-like ATPase
LTQVEPNPTDRDDWKVYDPRRMPDPDIDPVKRLPPAPPWRRFDASRDPHRGETFVPTPGVVEMVNAAIYLRRPLLVTGWPGTGKSSLAYSIAHTLRLEPVLHWPISTRTTLQDGLYRYDAIGRLREPRPAETSDAAWTAARAAHQTMQEVARFIHLGPLGTALLPVKRPRVLLIDEIDKGDIDLPNDLLHVFENGDFSIPELTRLVPGREDGSHPNSHPPEEFPVSVETEDNQQREIVNGYVRCDEFPIVILTSNGERDFPPAFQRRCLRLDIQYPKPEELERIIKNHFKDEFTDQDYTNIRSAIADFVSERDATKKELATDQFLNLVFMTYGGFDLPTDVQTLLRMELLRSLNPIP